MSTCDKAERVTRFGGRVGGEYMILRDGGRVIGIERCESNRYKTKAPPLLKAMLIRSLALLAPSLLQGPSVKN